MPDTLWTWSKDDLLAEVRRLRRQVELLKDDISACNVEIEELRSDAHIDGRDS